MTSKWILFLMCCGIAIPAYAGEAVQITADHMRMDALQHQAHFSGGVHLTRGDFQLWSDQLLVLYQHQHIQKAIADGRVRMIQLKKTGMAEHAVFENSTRIVTLKGNASVENEQGVVRGETIIYHIDSQETIVSQGNKQAAHLHFEDTGNTQP